MFWNCPGVCRSREYLLQACQLQIIVIINVTTNLEYDLKETLCGCDNLHRVFMIYKPTLFPAFGDIISAGFYAAFNK